MKWYAIQFTVIVIAVALVLAFISLVSFFTRQHMEHQYDDEISNAVRAVHVDPLLVRAIIWRESNFDSTLIGAANERGLMQVTPIAAHDWARAYKVDDFSDEELFDPQKNITVGTWLIGRALYRWRDRDDPLPFALAEYNAGRSHALHWVDPNNPNSAAAFLERIDFPTTLRYVQVIINRYHLYQHEANQSDILNWLHQYIFKPEPIFQYQQQ